MRTRTIIFAVLIIAHGCGIVHKKEAVNNQCNDGTILSDNQCELIFNKIRSFPSKTQISIAFIRDDSTFFYGVKRENDTVITINNKDKVFEVGSITKVFTSTLLAGLVVDGKIKLDDPINDKVSFELNDSISITYKELANHTSGLPKRPSDIVFSLIRNPCNPYKNYSTDKLERYLSKKMKPSQDPGLKYEYSNLGAGVLGYVICKIEKNDYQSLLNEKIFSRYGMTNSTTVKEDIEDILVYGIGPFGNKISNWDFASLEAAGNILSTANDLSKFVVAQFDTSNRELMLTREKTFSVDDHLDIGLGWHIIKDKSDGKWYWHNGGTGGYRASMTIDIENKRGIIVLSNVSVGHKKNNEIDNLCFELMKRF